MTGQVTTPGHIRVVLPGAWANVPLPDAETTRAFAQRLVRDRVGRDDRLASVRRDAVNQLCDTADKARASGSHTLAIALEIVPGVPFAASMVARDTPWPSDGARTAPAGEDAPADDAPALDPAAPEDVVARLEREFPGAEIVELPAGPAARTHETGVIQGKEETATSVSVAYRIPRPDSGELLHVRFTGPDVGRPELIAQLFDAIAGSVEFTRSRVLADRPTS